MSADKLCMSCMRSVPEDARCCPHCGYDGTQNNPENCLAIGTRLKGGRYVIGMRAETDGDSITYIAFDCKLGVVVFVREFLPKGVCSRQRGELVLSPAAGFELRYKTLLVDFCELYGALSRLPKDTPVVRVVDFFEANGTAYAVLERFAGLPLRELLSRAGGTVSFDQAYALLEPVGAALSAIHRVNLIHRGVSPTTIFINRNGDVRLSGFATSSVRTRGTDVTPKLQSGYSAPEQYAVEMWQGTATDVYALAAVMYRCVTGTTPPDAEQRRSYDTLESASSLNNGVPARVSHIMSLAMLINSRERIQTPDEFLARLFSDPPEQPVRPEDESEEVHPENGRHAQRAQRGQKNNGAHELELELERSHDERDEKRRKGLPWYGVVLVVLAVAAVCAVMWKIGVSLMNSIEQGEAAGGAQSQSIEGDVPSYVGQDVNSIEKNDKLFTYTYEFVVDADTAANTVVRQSPEAGSHVEAQNGEKVEIILYVSRGKRVPMVNVEGLDVAEAEKLLSENGIKYVTLDEQTASYVEGTVLNQSIKEGTLIDPESQTVTIRVAKAPAPESEPDEGENGENGENGGESNGDSNWDSSGDNDG